jgi:predicted nucleic acid-binding Zn ribbon protein
MSNSSRCIRCGRFIFRGSGVYCSDCRPDLYISSEQKVSS